MGKVVSDVKAWIKHRFLGKQLKFDLQMRNSIAFEEIPRKSSKIVSKPKNFPLSSDPQDSSRLLHLNTSPTHVAFMSHNCECNQLVS
jgi:hypothetical protein